MQTKNQQEKILVQTLFDKQNYTLHYQSLKLYVELGMAVSKLHRVLFKQEMWLSSYLKQNTEKRKQAKKKFEEDFYKVMGNSSFGKTCEVKQNRMKVKLTRNEEETLKWTEKPETSHLKLSLKIWSLYAFNNQKYCGTNQPSSVLLYWIWLKNPCLSFTTKL